MVDKADFFNSLRPWWLSKLECLKKHDPNWDAYANAVPVDEREMMLMVKQVLEKNSVNFVSTGDMFVYRDALGIHVLHIDVSFFLPLRET